MNEIEKYGNNSLINPILYPNPSNPQRIADEVLSVLTGMPCVRRVAIFGSLAENRADRWSDIDMHVVCDGVEANAWAAALAITSAKPVLFYRKFGTREQPSGRYWFAGESPFNRLDISFICEDDYQSYLDDNNYFGHEITLREVYTSDLNSNAAGDFDPKHFLEPAADYETEIGAYIYFSLEALKHCLRGKGCPDKHIPRIAGLRKAIPNLPRHLVLKNGCIGELAHQVCDMLEHLQIP